MNIWRKMRPPKIVEAKQCKDYINIIVPWNDSLVLCPIRKFNRIEYQSILGFVNKTRLYSLRDYAAFLGLVLPFFHEMATNITLAVQGWKHSSP